MGLRVEGMNCRVYMYIEYSSLLQYTCVTYVFSSRFHVKYLTGVVSLQGDGQHVVEIVPRAREVGQSWVTSAFTALHTLAVSFILLARHRPSLILANGPGTCVPLCAGAILLRVLGVSPTRVVFVESLCRVRSLSFSGQLLYPISDHFIVQWPQLTINHHRARYMGRLV